MVCSSWEFFKSLSQKYPDPSAVQRLIRTFPYNGETEGETIRSAQQAFLAGTVHCLEAAFISAAILEHQGYPPLVLSMESIDDLDHVLFIFQEKGRWGAISRSREEGLHGRKPIFRSLRDLVWSYFDPYVDNTGRITAFGWTDLDQTGAPWRDSKRHVWQAEQYLIELRHKRLRAAASRVDRAFRQYRDFGFHPPQKYWW